MTREELQKEIERFVKSVYLTGYDQGEHEASKEAFEQFYDNVFEEEIMAIFAREQDLHEIEIRKGILRRISLNESNDYPLVDESKSLADVKEAQINRIKQLTTQLPEEKEA